MKLKHLPSTIVTHANQLFNWLLPQSCFLCGGLGNKALCPACLADLPYQQNACNRCALPLEDEEHCPNCQKYPVVFDRAKTVFVYEYPLNKMIQAAKYNQDLTILKILGHQMAQHLVIDKLPDVLIPVPLHPKGLRNRGYNQALELTKIIAKYHNISYNYTACQCIKRKRKQSTLSAIERRENVKGIFQIKQIKPYWQHVVLIDDVMTTGATVNELATIFLQAGVQRVEVWCCARSELTRKKPESTLSQINSGT